jgi:hypothetical protein
MGVSGDQFHPFLNLKPEGVQWLTLSNMVLKKMSPLLPDIEFRLLGYPYRSLVTTPTELHFSPSIQRAGNRGL